MTTVPEEKILLSGLDTNTHSTRRPVEKSRTLFEKVIVARLAKNSPAFCEPEPQN
jgi:hypothetical protein